MHRLCFILIILLMQLGFSYSTEAQTILSDPRARINGNVQGPTDKFQNYPQKVTIRIPNTNEKPRKIKPPTGARLVVPKKEDAPK